MLETKLNAKVMIHLPDDYKTARKMMCSHGDYSNEFTKWSTSLPNAFCSSDMFQKSCMKFSASVYQHGICSRKFSHRVTEQGVYLSGAGPLSIGPVCFVSGSGVGGSSQTICYFSQGHLWSKAALVYDSLGSFTAQTFNLFFNYRREIQGILAVEHYL